MNGLTRFEKCFERVNDINFDIKQPDNEYLNTYGWKTEGKIICFVKVPFFALGNAFENAGKTVLKTLPAVILVLPHLVQKLRHRELTASHLSVAAVIVHALKTVAFIASAILSPLVGLFSFDKVLILNHFLTLIKDYSSIEDYRPDYSRNEQHHYLPNYNHFELPYTPPIGNTPPLQLPPAQMQPLEEEFDLNEVAKGLRTQIDFLNAEKAKAEQAKTKDTYEQELLKLQGVDTYSALAKELDSQTTFQIDPKLELKDATARLKHLNNLPLEPQETLVQRVSVPANAHLEQIQSLPKQPPVLDLPKLKRELPPLGLGITASAGFTPGPVIPLQSAKIASASPAFVFHTPDTAVINPRKAAEFFDCQEELDQQDTLPVESSVSETQSSEELEFKECDSETEELTEAPKSKGWWHTLSDIVNGLSE